MRLSMSGWPAFMRSAICMSIGRRRIMRALAETVTISAVLLCGRRRSDGCW